MGYETTAWGETLLEYATPLSGGVMGTTWETMGTVKEDSLAFETADGTKLQLWGSGHVLVDEMLNEGTINLKSTILKIPDAIKEDFWAFDNGTKQVSSLVNSTHFSIRMRSKIAGSETFLAPWCSVNMKPMYSEKEGWTADVNISILKGDADYFFEFGTATA